MLRLPVKLCRVLSAALLLSSLAQLLSAQSPIPTTVTLVPIPVNPSAFDQEITLTALVSPSTNMPVTFYSNGTLLGTSAGAVGGLASITTNALFAGTNILTAVYDSTDPAYLPSVSPPVIQTVSPVPSALLSSPIATTSGTSSTNQPVAVAVGNFNTLGTAAVTANSADQSISILSGLTTGAFTQKGTIGIGHSPTAIALGDFNADGQLDIAVTTDDGFLYIYVSLGSGAFSPPAVCPGAGCPLVGNNLTSIVVSDFNRDGILDLAVAGSNGIVILLGLGNGTFTTGYTDAPGGFSPASLITGDFNRDGIQDLAAVSEGQVYILSGVGNGTFLAPACPGPACFAAGIGPVSMAAGDFNNDGILDLAVADSVRTNENVIIFLGNGDGTFSAAAPCVAAGPGCPSAGIGAKSIAVTDINNDGIADLVIANESSNTVSVLTGLGNGGFNAAVNFPVDAGPVSMAVAPLDNTGRVGVITANQFADDVTVLLGQQSTQAKVAVSVSPTSSPQGGAVSLVVSVIAPPTSLVQPTGSATFFDNGSSIVGPQTLTGGTVNLQDSNFPPGTNNITATYSGDAAFAAASSNAAFVTVGGNFVPTAVTLAPSSLAPSADQNVNIQVTVGNLSGTVSPPGTVTLSDGAAFLGSQTLQNGSATFVVIFPVGLTLLSASYGGAEGFNPSAATLPLNVSALATATGIVSSANPVGPQQSVTLTATVTPLSGSDQFVPTGTITFSGSGRIQSSPITLDDAGQASFPFLLPPGQFNITAAYSGSSTLAASSGQITQFSGGATQISLAGPPAVQYGSVIPLVATVTPSSATGNVTFYDGTAILGAAVLVNGTATLSTPFLSPGYQYLSARYNGDANNGPSVVSLTGNAGIQVDAVAESGLGQAEVVYDVAAGNVVVADFNGDGIADIASASASTGQIAVVLGDGGGVFVPSQTLQVPESPFFLAATDINGDGITDLVASSGVGTNLTVFLGNGNGTFQSGFTVPGVATSSLGFPGGAIADFNGDGRADILFPEFTNGSAIGVDVLLGNGDGTFQPVNRYPVTSNYAAVAVADFNGDGKPDVAISNFAANSVSILLGNGDGTFKTRNTIPVTPLGPAIIAADVNGDGKQDLVVSSSTGVLVLLGNGDGTFLNPISTSLGIEGFAMAVTDVNADNEPDLIIAGLDSTSGAAELVVATNMGNGTFVSQVYPYAPGLSVSFLYSQILGIADINGDGRPDVVTAAPNGVVVFFGLGPNSTLTLTATPNPAAPGQAVTLTASDPQASGTVTFFDGTVQIGTAVLSGGVAALTIASLSPGTHSLTATLNGLSSNAVVETISTQSMVMLSSSVNPSTFGALTTLTATVSPVGATGKVTFYNGATVLGDGPVTGGIATLASLTLPAGTLPLTARYSGDAVFMGATSPVLSQVVNSVPASSLAAPVVYSIPDSPLSIVAADFNRDGKIDLVTANQFGSYSLLLSFGDGSFQPAITQGLSLALSAVTSNDFNGDGIPDLAFTDNSVDQLLVLTGNGDGTFSGPGQGVSIGDSPVAIASADLNGDGNVDLIVVNNGSNNVSVLLGQGGGAFAQAVSYPVGNAPTAIDVGDLNGDGFVDLAVTNSSDNTVSVLLGAGDGNFRAGAAVPTGNFPNDVIIRDFNSDGKPDLAVSNGNDLSVSVLLGNGDGTFAAGTNYPLPQPASPEALAAVDLNGDGKIDLAILDGYGDLNLLLGNGDGTFQLGASYQGIGGPAFVAASFRGSGLTDFAIAGQNETGVAILLGVPNQGSPVVSNTPPPSATVGTSYNFTFMAAGGTPPYQWVLSAGSGPAPPGLALNAAGTLSGTPATAGEYPFSVTVVDSQGLSAVEAVTISVAAATLASAIVVLSSSTNPSAFGAPATLTATIRPNTAAGTVTFYNGSTMLGASPVASGQAVLSTITLPVGALALTARYDGSAGLGSSVSGVLNQTINSVAAGSFAGPYSYPLPGQPVSMIEADLNRDGKMDLVTANTAGSYSVLLGNGDGTFQPAVTQTVGSSFSGVVTGDFNGDGIPDLALAGLGSYQLTILIGLGDGTFSEGPGIALDNGASALASSDVNGDGIADLIVANQFESGVSVLLGTGNGAFAAAVTYSLNGYYSSGATGLALGDFNQDGFPDIAVTASDSNSVFVLLGAGDGTFRPAVGFFTGAFPTGLIIQDLNGDRKLDLAVANQDDGAVSVLPGNGDGTFAAAVSYPAGSQPFALTTLDFNADGKPDLAVADLSGGNVTILLGNGDGTFQPAVAYPTGGQFLSALVAGSYRGNGLTDLAVASYDTSAVNVLLGVAIGAPLTISSGAPFAAVTGDPYSFTFTAIGGSPPYSWVLAMGSGPLPPGLTVSPAGVLSGTPSTAGSYPFSVIVTDSHGLIATAPFTITVTGTTLAPSTVILTSSLNPSTFGAALTLSATVSPSGAAGTVTFYNGFTVIGTATVASGTASLAALTLPAGALNLSARYDGGSNFGASVSAPLGQTITSAPDISFAASVPYGLGNGEYPFAIVAADLNRDGKIDLVTADETGSYSLLLGNGDGTFQMPVAQALGANLTGAAVADFNGDGIPDLAFSNNASNEVLISIGNGDGTFNPSDQPVPVGFYPLALVSADVNGDGYADLIAVNSLGNDVSVILGHGDGTFQTAVEYAAGEFPYAIDVGDLNGDGYADVVVANINDGTVSVLLGVGDGTFQATQAVPSGDFPSGVAVGDFNGDGKLDLAVSNEDGDTVSILIGDGTGAFGPPASFGVGSAPYRLTTLDFNGDGKLDLAVANYSSGTISVLLGNGDGTFQAAASYPAGQSPFALVAASFRGNGLSDLAVTDLGLGAVNVLLGVANASSLVISSGPPPAAIIGSPYSFTFTAAGGTPPYNWAFSPSSGPIPPGLALVSSGTLSGAAITLGDYPISVTVTDSQSHTATGNFSVPEIQPNVTASITSSASLPNALAGTPYNFPCAATASVPGAFTWSATGLPAGLTINSATGAISGTPTAAGSFTPAINLVFAPGPLDPLTGDPFPGGVTPASFDVSVQQNATLLGLAPLLVSPGSLAYSQTIGSTGPSSQTLAVSSLGAAVSFIATASGIPGLTLGLAAGQTPGSVPVIVDATGLQPGAYNGAVIISSSTTVPASQTVPVTLTVLNPPTLVLAVSPSPSTYGALTTLKATLSSATATGKVTFYNGSSVLGIAPVASGTATLTTILLPPDAQALTARYDGDSNFPPATTPISMQRVNTLSISAFGAPVAFAVNQPDTIVSGDFNLDGNLDLAIGTGDGSFAIFLGNGDDTFQPGATQQLESQVFALAASDYNGDGIPDLAVASGSQVIIFQGAGGGSFAGPGQTIAIGTDVQALAASDLNLDGNVDLVAVNNVTSAVSVLLGQGDGTFAAPVTYPVTEGASALAVGDLNGDGFTDLVVASYNTNTVSVLLGNGDGTFQPAVPVSTAFTPGSLLVQDFNADGKLDLAVSSLNDGEVNVFLGNGDGTFAKLIPLLVGAGPGALAAGDFNADGKTDLVVANSSNGNVSTLLGNGDGTFQAAINYPAGLDPAGLIAGSFNGSGLTDLAVINLSTNTANVLPGIAGGNQGAPLTISTAVPSGASIGTPYMFTFTATGGAAPYKWSANTLPPGLTLNSMTGTLSGIATTLGDYPISVTVTDSTLPQAQTATGNFTVPEIQPNVVVTIVSSATLPGALAGTPYSFQCAALANVPGVFTWSAAGLPAGLTINPGTGVIGGLPAAAGQFTPAISVVFAPGPVNPLTGLAFPGGSTPPSADIPATQNATIQATAPLQVTPSSLAFTQMSGANTPVSQPLNIAAGGATVTFTAVVSGGTWLTLGSNSGQTPSSLQVIVNAAGLQPNTYNGSVIITSSATSPTSQTIPVSLLVSAVPQLSVNVPALLFTATPGQLMPPVQSIQISDTNSVPITVTVATATGGNWLSVSSISGNTPLSLAVTTNATNLSPGTYSGTVSIASPGLQTLVVPVTLALTASVLVSPSTLSFTYNAGLPAPLPQAIAIGAGTTPVAFNAMTSGEPWLSLSAQSGTTPASISAAVNASGLSVGTYSSTITVSFGGVAPPQTVAVTLSVPQPGQLSLSLPQAGLSFASVPPGAVSAQTFTIGSSNGTSIPFQIALDPAGSPAATSNRSKTVAGALALSAANPSITVSPLSGATPALITVTVDSSNLAPMTTYSHTLAITSLGTTVPEALNITTAPAALAPALVVTPSLVQGQVQPGTSETIPISIQNANGSGTLPYNITVTNLNPIINGAPWLSIPQPTGNANGSVPLSVQIAINASGLAPGVYTATLHITLGSLTPVTLPVSITVLSANLSMQLGSIGTTLLVRQGQGFSLPSQIPVIDLGNAPFTATASVDPVGQNYISVTPSVTSTPTAPGILNVSVNPSFATSPQTQPGLYYATVTVSSNQVTNSPLLFLAVIQVQNPALVPEQPFPAPSGLVFVSSGGLSPAPQTFQVYASALAPVSFQTGSQEYSGPDIDAGTPANWLYVLSTTGTASTSTPGTVQVAANTAGLAEGTYTGGITVTMSGSSRVVHVTLIVPPGNQASPSQKPAGKLTAKRDLAATASTPPCVRSSLVPTFIGGLPGGFVNEIAGPTLITVQVNDNCGALVPDPNNPADVPAVVDLIFSAGDPPDGPMMYAGQGGQYTYDWTPDTPENNATVTVVAGPNVSASGQATGIVGGQSQSNGQTNPSTGPVLNPRGIVNNFDPTTAGPLAPGTIVQIYGTNFQTEPNPKLVYNPGMAADAPLDGVQVTIGGSNAYLYYVSPYPTPGGPPGAGVIGAEVPTQLMGNTSYEVQISVTDSVNNTIAYTLAYPITLVPAAPGETYSGQIFAQTFPDFQAITSTHPVTPGDYVVLYVDGLGATNPLVPTGVPAPSPAPITTSTVQIYVDDKPIPTSSSGYLITGLVGLYQINFIMPSGTSPGAHALAVEQNGRISGMGTIYVGNPPPSNP